MVKCVNCGKEIDSVMVNTFLEDGSDKFIEVPLINHGDGVYGFDVNLNWTGYGLDDEDRTETIECPHCRKFPFKNKETEYNHVLHVTCEVIE